MNIPQSRVFIPQHPTTFDRATGLNVNVGDLTPVMKLGHPIFMLPPGRLKTKWLDKHIRILQRAMFDYSPDDFLLMTGDLSIQAAAIIIAARQCGGAINIVRWLRQTNEFKVFPLDTGARI